MKTSRELKPVGWYFWFALGAFVLGALFVLAEVSLVPTVLWILALVWTGVGLSRVVRIHRHVTRRTKVH